MPLRLRLLLASLLAWLLPVACSSPSTPPDVADAAGPSLDAADDAAPDEPSTDVAADPLPDAVLLDTDLPDAPDLPDVPDVPDVLDADSSDADTADADPSDADTAGDTLPDAAHEEHCAEVEGFGPVFADVVATWGRQDDAAPWPSSPLVLVGSSSVRRWEGFAEVFSDYEPLQRGFGGAQLGEVALDAQDLVVRHAPRAVLVYAGTNDVAAGVSAAVVVERFRCLRQRIGQGVGWDRPVFFIGITPSPARWASWDVARAVNMGVLALEDGDPAVHYVDVPAAFLATGAPPAASLFVSDGLHLSPEGYALWSGALRPAVEGVLAPLPRAASGVDGLAPGDRVLIDLGPNNAGDGEDSPSPDYLGQRWNNWHGLDGDGQVLPGEHLDDLQTTTGEVTSIDLVIAGGFSANGWANGGLRWPSAELLGDLAVGSATGDFFFVSGADVPGALFLRGLDPARRYTLRLFASRDDVERRITRFRVTGAATVSATVQTSGAGAAGAGGTANDDDVIAFAGVQPDAWGHVFVDLGLEEGSYAYLSLLELRAE